MKVFGVGCLYFGYSEDYTKIYYMSRAEFLEDVKRRLENVENVSQVTKTDNGVFPSLSHAIIKNDDNDIVVPLAHGAHIEFDIFLPFRIQESIHLRCDVETIHVDIVWEYDMPLAFISYEWPEEEGGASTSTAVVVVRKYLEKKLEDENFIFDCVGPSPFHANFIVVETALNDGFKLKDVSIERIGYASMEIEGPRGASVLECADSTRLTDTLSKFYQLSELRSRAIDEQISIIANSRGLLKQENPSSVWRKIERVKNRPKEIDILNQNVFEEMLIRLDMSSSLSETERYQLISSEHPLDRFFDRYREMSIEQSWGKFSDVAKFFEERHQKAVGNITAVSAGVIGGIIGSLIGSLATYILTSG